MSAKSYRAPEMTNINLPLTAEQAEALKWLLAEESQRVNDDGREGEFERSPLYAVYRNLLREIAR